MDVGLVAAGDGEEFFLEFAGDWPGHTFADLNVIDRTDRGDFDGGVIAFGASYRSPVGGEASLIAYDDGSYTVGAWGRDNDPARQVVALRQNLGMLVDGGAPTPAASNPGAWGASGSTLVHFASIDEETMGEALTLAWQNALDKLRKGRMGRMGRKVKKGKKR